MESTVNEKEPCKEVKENIEKTLWGFLASSKGFPHSLEEAEKVLEDSLKPKGGLHLSIDVVKQDKIVLPRDVADYLKYGKKHGHSLFGVFGQINRKKLPERKRKVSEWIESNSEKFAQAWIAGEYELEPEEEFFWRKKEEFCTSFETLIWLQVNVETEKPTLTSYLSRPFSKSEAKKLLGKDFSMFEKEKITDLAPKLDDHPF